MKLTEAIKEGHSVSIKDLLHDRVGGKFPQRSHKIVHASDLTKDDKAFCPREFALLDITGKKPKPEWIETALQVTFDMGRDMQRRFNEDWLQSEMYGDWVCNSCGAATGICQKPKGHCGRSGIRCQWEYHEARFTSEVSGVSCGLDALVFVGEPKLRIVEYKTIARPLFDTLKTAFAEHRLRSQLYLKLIAESGDARADQINLDVVHIVYHIKGYGKKDTKGRMSPWKEYLIKRNDEAVKDLENPVLALNAWRAEQLKLPLGVCPTSFCQRAKVCPVVKECFSGKYVGTLTWQENGIAKHTGKQCVE